MPTNTVKGFNVNGSTVQYDYESLADRILKSSIGNEYSSSNTYKVDDYVLYAGQLYRCIIEITTPQSFDSTKWEPVSAGSDLKWLKKYYSINDEIKQALLNCFQHVAWTDTHGQDYYDALEAALYRTADLDYITAVFNQGQNVIYDTDSLDTLKQYLTVTAYYNDGDESIITSYNLIGDLVPGTSTIIVLYGTKIDSFDVEVTRLLPEGYTKVTAIEATQPSMSSVAARQYIDLGFVAEETKKYKIETQIMWKSTQPAVSKNLTPQMFLSGLFLIANHNGYYSNFITSSTPTSIPCSTTSYDSVVAEIDCTTLEYTYSINNLIGSGTRSAFGSPREAGLFASYSTASAFVAGSACCMKETNIYIDDVLYMKLVPCVRNLDSVAGFYDKISETFKVSDGPNAFTYIA